MAPAATPIELSLHSLLPTVSPLPPDLVSLAKSLLAQSKSTAAHLKAEEEVGRIYAVCHIAAERLSGRHGWEIGRPSPPVKPSTYARLKGFLEGSLGAPSTPRTRRGEVKAGRGDVSKGRENCSGVIKTPESRATSLRKKWAEARKPTRVKTPEVTGLEVPVYGMPMIRHLCKACDVGKAVPHVFTGVSVVLKEQMARVEGSGRKRKRGAADDDAGIGEEDVPGVILAVFVAVVKRMYGEEVLVDMAYLEAAKECVVDEKMGLPLAAREEIYFDAALLHFDRPGRWSDMEWFGNVPEATSTVHGDDEGDNEVDEDVLDTTLARKRPAKTPLRRKEKHGGFAENADLLGRAGLLPGLGTMFQPAVDWLSDERVDEFESWRRDVRKEITSIEQIA